LNFDIGTARNHIAKFIYHINKIKTIEGILKKFENSAQQLLKIEGYNERHR